MANTSMTGFLRGFTGTSLQLLQLQEAKRRHEEQQELQKEQIRILRDRAKGQQAEFELKQAEFLQKLGRPARLGAPGDVFQMPSGQVQQLGEKPQTLSPQAQTFQSLVQQGFSPQEALQEVSNLSRGASEAGMALQAAGGDPEKALGIMRQQRTASRALTNIQIGAKEAKQQEQERITAGIVTQDINRVLSLMQLATLPTTGAAGAFLAKIPGTSAANMKFLLDTIRANIGFQKLQQMRAASPTGGALGQVSERENALLQATMGSLEQAQTQEQFVYNLQRIHDQFLDTVHGPGNGPPRLLGGRQGTAVNESLQNLTDEELEAEIKRLQGK